MGSGTALSWLGVAVTSFVVFAANQQPLSVRVGDLVKLSNKKLGVCFSGINIERTNPLKVEDVAQALQYINSHEDYSSCYLLFVIRKYYPESYKKVSAITKAKIWSSVLATTMAMNDWKDPSSSPSEVDRSDPERIRLTAALLEVGEPAIEYLTPILDNDQEAGMFGSEEATLSKVAKFRRKDYASSYISGLLRIEYRYSSDPRDRDVFVNELKDILKKRKATSQ